MVDELPHPNIKHVVVLMLENRGFDHLMGWLYTADETPTILPPPRDDAKRRFLGLSCLQPDEFSRLSNPSPRGTLFPPRQGARSPTTPSYNPGESFGHIMNQMWSVDAGAEEWLQPPRYREVMSQLDPDGNTQPPMTGYVLDFSREVQRHSRSTWQRIGLGGQPPPAGDDVLREIMETYTPEQMPVLSGLARFYAVSDEWFCSVPSQTNTNRAFSMAGTSRGMVNNSFYDPYSHSTVSRVEALKRFSGGISNCDALPSEPRTLFEVLQQAGYSWKLYWQDTWPPEDIEPTSRQYVRTMFPQLSQKNYDANFVRFDPSRPSNEFYVAAREGRLPAVSWIEPAWGGGDQWNASLRQNGNDMHPVCDTTVAEDFVMDVYIALSSNQRAWAQTLLVITFDENGGTYDHVPPPLATSGSRDQRPPSVVDPESMDPQTRTQFGFDFTRFGARVPTLLVSPCIGPRTLVRSGQEGTPFDHTSLIASVLELAGIPRAEWDLGHRVAAAPTFVAQLSGTIRPDALDQPCNALTAPMPRRKAREQREPLQTQRPYLLEYLGDPSRSASSGGPYLGPTYLNQWTMTNDQQRAGSFKFTLVGATNEVTMVLNMSVLFVVSCASPAGSGIAVEQEWPTAYAANDPTQLGTRWQVRLLGSRDPREPVCAGDEICFISLLPPSLVQSTSRRVTPDPLKRLLPKPDSQFLTTRAGEWALWRAVPRT